MARIVLGIPVAALFVAACAGDGGPAAPLPVVLTAPPPPTARYSVTFEATWNSGSHPTDFPANAHFSSLIGGTHRASVSFWEPGALATEGVRLMAERGRQSPLDTEVNAAITAGLAQHLLTGGDVPVSPGSISLEFQVSVEYPLVTLVTMVAPSPDWFVGVHGLSLLENGAWVAERSVDLFPYDAGTDSGATYRAPDEATSPRDPIQRLTGHPVAVNSVVAPMGSFVFRRLDR